MSPICILSSSWFYFLNKNVSLKRLFFLYSKHKGISTKIRLISQICSFGNKALEIRLECSPRILKYACAHREMFYYTCPSCHQRSSCKKRCTMKTNNSVNFCFNWVSIYSTHGSRMRASVCVVDISKAFLCRLMQILMYRFPKNVFSYTGYDVIYFL